MTTKALRWIAALGVSAAVLLGAAPVAYADSTPAAGSIPKPGKNAGIEAWKAAEDARIAVRVKTLDALAIAVHGATNLTSAHRSTLTQLIASDKAGLTALEVKIDAASDVAIVKADGRGIIVDYRIYMLATPQVRFTMGSDIQAAAVARLKDVHDKLAAVVNKLAADGKDVAQEQAQLDDMSAKLAAATSATTGQADALLAVKPSPDASAMHAAVAPVRAAMHAGRDNLKAAIADAKKVRAELKAMVGKS
jgi:hypothetical protein